MNATEKSEKSVPMNGMVQGCSGMTTIEHGMKFRAVMMTPVVASKILEHNHPRNRKAKERRITLYGQDIANDQWYLTHEAVAVDEDGWLIDGQNRLHAIVLANKPAPILLVTGVPKKALMMVDQGASRNVVDMAKIQKFSDDMPSISNWLGCARSMMLGIRLVDKTRNRPQTNQEILAFLKAHQDAVAFAMECLPQHPKTKGVGRAAVRGVFGRAYYLPRTKHDRIREFADILCSGLPGNIKTDSAAIRLRNFLLDAGAGRQRRKGMRLEPQIMYARTQTALKAFLEERNLESLRDTTSEELFKLPEEKS